MAELIRTKLMPHKRLLQQQWKIIPYNRVISADALKANVDNLDLLTKSIKGAQEQIRQYCQSKQTVASEGFARSFRRYVANIAVETIVAVLTWQRNARLEAQAIYALAQEIAANITNCKDLCDVEPKRLDQITAELKALVTWHIALPKQMLTKTIARHQSHIPGLDITFLLKAHDQESGAQLWINTQDQSFKLDFFDADIDKILCSVQNQLLAGQKPKESI